MATRDHLARRLGEFKLDDRLIRLAGVDPAELQEPTYASDRARYRAMGFSVYLTAAFAFFAMTATLTLATGNFSLAFLIAAALWSLFIFNLDRWIISTADYGTDRWRPIRTAGLTICRLAVAILIGLSISEPVLLLVFNSEISAKVEQDRERELIDRLDQISTDPTYDPDRTPEAAELASATLGLEQARNALLAANAALDAEIGGGGGTGLRGAGGRSQQRSVDLANAQVALDSAQRQFDEAQGDFDLARQDLSGQQLEAEGSARREIAERNSGLIDREKALARLATEEPSVVAIQWLARGLILLIDITPLLLKLVSPLTIYEIRRSRTIQSALKIHHLRNDQLEKFELANIELESAAALHRARRDFAVEHDDIARKADLAHRRIIAEHGKEILQRGYNKIENFDSIEFADRINERLPLTINGPRSERDSSSSFRSLEPRSQNIDDSGRSDPGEITFDRAPRRNVQGKPGEGLLQHVSQRWIIGNALAVARGPEAWRTAFFAQDILEPPGRSTYYVVKRVALPSKPGEKRPTPPNEVQSLPDNGHEISPFVAPLIQAGYDPEFGYFTVMPYYRNGTLQQYIDGASSEKLSLGLALTYTDQILQGLLAVFTERVVLHNDIKPSNIALGDRNIRIIDWGLADGELMASHNVGYSLWYAPPEQVTAEPGSKVLRSPLCDIRGVGATLYALVTGRPPLFAEACAAGLVDNGILIRPEEFRQTLLHVAPVRLESFFAANSKSWNRSALQPLSDLVAKWLDPEPSNRTRSARAADYPQQVALEELRAVVDDLAGLDTSDLTNAVGKTAFPMIPLIKLPKATTSARPTRPERPGSSLNTVVPRAYFSDGGSIAGEGGTA